MYFCLQLATIIKKEQLKLKLLYHIEQNINKVRKNISNLI